MSRLLLACALVLLAGSAPARAADDLSWIGATGVDVVAAGGTGIETCVVASFCQASPVSTATGAFGAAGPGAPGGGLVPDPSGNRVLGMSAQDVRSSRGKDVIAAGQRHDTGTGPEFCRVVIRCQPATAGGLGGEFDAPVAADQYLGTGVNDLYVVDAGNHRIQRFAAGTGAFLAAWGRDVVKTGAPGDTGTGYEVCTVATDCKPGTAGTLGGELTAPTAVAADNAGHVFVAGDGRIQRYTTAGVFERAWGKGVAGGAGYEVCTAAANCQAGTAGGVGGEFSGALGLGSGPGNPGLYVTDAGNHRVQRFAVDGTFERAWGKGVNGGGAFGVCTVRASCQAGSAGGLGGEFDTPIGVAVNQFGVYVAERTGRRLQHFGFDGAFMAARGRGVLDGTPGTGYCTVPANCRTGTTGALGGEFSSPSGVTTFAGGVMVADGGNRRMDAFGTGTASTTIGTFESSLRHRYDLFHGTLTLKRAGQADEVVPAFASGIRVTQAVADATAAQLGPDVGQGFAGTAPDGGIYLTTGAAPGWWEKPDGTTADKPSFDAASVFAGQLAATPRLAAGEAAACTDTTAAPVDVDDFSATPWPSDVRTVITFGPEAIPVGEDHLNTYNAFVGETVYDVITTLPAFVAHRVDRTCVVTKGATPSPTATVTASPTATPTVVPPDETVGKPTACRAIGGVGRDKTLRGVTLVTRRADDPSQPIRLSVRGKVKTVKYSLNGRKTGGSVSTALLKAGKNRIVAKVKLKNGKTVTFRRTLRVGACPQPAVTCIRGPGTLTCTSTALPRVRKVKVTVGGLTATATPKAGRYTAVLKGTVAAGTYLYKSVATTTRKGERILSVRAVTIG